MSRYWIIRGERGYAQKDEPFFGDGEVAWVRRNSRATRFHRRAFAVELAIQVGGWVVRVRSLR